MGGIDPKELIVREFEEFRKIPRLVREVVVTEKIDGTNAQIYIAEDDTFHVGSRSKWITPDDDNFGFARWAKEHEDELRVGLGYGRHYGEWWGAGVGRKYGLKEKRFSLFNTSKWSDDLVRPKCCGVVPVLYKGPFDTNEINSCLNQLIMGGSVAAPGFMKPEGVVVYHVAGDVYFKQTIEKDDVPKGLQK